MKRKLFLGLAALAALTVTSCQKDLVINQLPDEQPIEFGTYVGRDAQTKASVIDKDDLLVNGFGVFAYYTETKDFTADQDGNSENGTQKPTPNFMNNQKVTGTKTVDTYSWEYSPVKYWPNEDGHKVSFFAYAPYDANKTLISTNYEPKILYTVENDVTKHIDILYANKVENATKNTITGVVQFNFFHALSRVGFNVEAVVDEVNADADLAVDDNDPTNTNDIDVNTEVTVKSVSLSGSFYPSGTLDLASSAGTKKDGATPGTNSPSWSNASAIVQNFTLDKDEFKTVNTTGQIVTKTKTQLNADNSYLMILPQNFTGTDEVTLTIVYDVITTDNTNETNSSTIENTITKSFNFNFEAGKAYMFNLHIGLTSVKVSADVESWDEAEYTVNVPINTAS